MDVQIAGLRLTFLLWILFATTCIAASTPAPGDNRLFDHEFQQFLREQGYRGGAVAAMKDGRLLLARGYGVDRQGQQVSAHSKFHVSSVAKSFTGLAILKLVQDKKLKLKDKVFGETGLLRDLQPWQRSSVDPRLYEITVEHLLRHSAGWDSTQPPLYDPLLNRVYLDRKHQVPDIAKDMGLSIPLDPEELISYVMSQPLHFSPGTQVAYSNTAYLVLGRVVEVLAQMEYRDFVKKYILDPCGMWNTRLELSPSQEVKETTTVKDESDKSIYRHLDPVSVDSALGWYSNVYDMMRFTRCALETGKILDDQHMELLLAKLDSTPNQHNDSWYGAGFRTNTRNIVWQDADPHADDLILYHNLDPSAGHGQKQQLPDSWVVMLYDKSIKHLRHHSRDLMAQVELTPPLENLFLYDLSELHRHMMWQPPTSYDTPEYTIRYRIDEHHLSAYVAAVQDEGFNIHWLTSYTDNDHTYFLLVCKRVQQPIRPQYDFIFEHGLDHRHLLKRKLQLEEIGYNMTDLHSYKSRSHDHPVCFAAIFRHDAFSSNIQMKYGTGHLPEPYEKLVQMYYEKKFHPISQTVVYHNKDEEFSFIFIKAAHEQRIDFKHFYDLSPHRLSRLTVDNAKNNMHLSYLNSYDKAGKSRFSAIYTNATTSRGLLETDQPKDRATEITISNLKMGLIPRFMVPYFWKDDEMKVAIYYEEF